jgi:hypothetical protein
MAEEDAMVACQPECSVSPVDLGSGPSAHVQKQQGGIGFGDRKLSDEQLVEHFGSKEPREVAKAINAMGQRELQVRLRR